jgi:hypothetical protein
MNHNTVLCTLILAGTAFAAPALAQRPMGVPPAVPAIETHLQQQRTMNQREAMEAKEAEAAEKPAPKPAAPKKKSAKKKRTPAAA